MNKNLWDDIILPSSSEELLWEYFHENSKTGHFDKALSNEQVMVEMANTYESLPYDYMPSIPLPSKLTSFSLTLTETILKRKSTIDLKPTILNLEQLHTMLYFAYGETRNNQINELIRHSFRTVPSAGALYPLEIYFYSNGFIEGLEPGLYHYSPIANSVQLIRKGDLRDELCRTIISFQSDIVNKVSLLFFITALFHKSIFKYGDKGYRFIFLEAGHVSQNLNLAATAMQFGILNIGGFHDRLIDDFLSIDGVNHSTIYMTAVGQSKNNVI